MSSFVRYILKFKEHDDAYGDIARDILDDPEVNRRWGYRPFVQHLVFRQASQRVFELVDDLYDQFRFFKSY